nr:hypothetical protein [Paenibacillus sp. DMB5]
MSHQTENIESSVPFIPAGHRSGAANAQESADVGTDAAYGNAAQNQPPRLRSTASPRRSAAAQGDPCAE